MTRPAGYDTTLGWTPLFIAGIAFTFSTTYAALNATNPADAIGMVFLLGAGACILPPVWLLAYGLECARRAMRKTPTRRSTTTNVHHN